MDARNNITRLNSLSEYALNNVIEVAKKTFVTGRLHNRNLRTELLNNTDLAETYHSRYYLAKKENSIPDDHDASHIPNTNFIASAGPKCKEEMEVFINNTIYHASKPVYTVVAFGGTLSYDKYTYQDFFDYCIKEREMNCGTHSVSIRRISGEFQATESGHQVFPHNVLNSKLTIADQSLNVYLFHLEDNMPIELFSIQSNWLHKITQEDLDVRKETMWLLFQKSLQENILVHCAAGVGRTGHFILTMEILKHYDDIFANDPNIAAQKILALLENMRSVRPALVYTEEQFTSAIRNANLMHAYALEKKYIKVNIEVAKPRSDNFVFFKPKNEPSMLVAVEEQAQLKSKVNFG